MVVSDIDLRLLRVFKAVVEAGGYTNAQTVLGVSQSTISTQMSQLEVRVGFSLCHRGRSGFKLTAEGESLYHLVVSLFQSMNDFQTNAAELKRGLSGKLRIGFLDNIISDDSNPLRRALSQFVQHPDNTVQITLESLPPVELEKGLLDQSLDLAIGIFDDKVSGLNYTPLYAESDILACHKDHPLALVKDPRVLARALPSSRRVVRAFLGYREFPFETDAEVTASVTSLEASTLMILTGQYIGFLPAHYSRPWLDKGELVALMPGHFHRQSQFSLVTKDSAQRHSRALDLFVECILESSERLQCGLNVSR